MTAPPGQRYLEDVSVGDTFEQSQQPTLDQVLRYLDLMGMFVDGRVSDLEAARAVGLERPVVPSQMTANMMTRVVTDWMGPLGRVLRLDIIFRRPLLQDDRLRCVGLVTEIDAAGDAEESGEGTVHLDLTLENERGETPLQGTAVVVLPRRP